jgi:hypothetical protein
MLQTPFTETRLTISSPDKELDFERISGLVGVAPSNTRSLYHLMKNGELPPVKSSEWSISTGELTLDSIDDGVLQMILPLESKLNSIRDYCAQHGATVMISSKVKIYNWEDRPFVQLSARSLALLRQLNAEWQLELVNLFEA